MTEHQFTLLLTVGLPIAIWVVTMIVTLTKYIRKRIAIYKYNHRKGIY